MSERENLTKVKIKKSQEKYLNFANLPIQEFCDDIELDINVNTILYDCAKKKLNPKSKENLTKVKNQSGKLILKRKLKR